MPFNPLGKCWSSLLLQRYHVVILHWSWGTVCKFPSLAISVWGFLVLHDFNHFEYFHYCWGSQLEMIRIFLRTRRETTRSLCYGWVKQCFKAIFLFGQMLLLIANSFSWHISDNFRHISFLTSRLLENLVEFVGFPVRVLLFPMTKQSLTTFHGRLD